MSTAHRICLQAPRCNSIAETGSAGRCSGTFHDPPLRDTRNRPAYGPVDFVISSEHPNNSALVRQGKINQAPFSPCGSASTSYKKRFFSVPQKRLRVRFSKRGSVGTSFESVIFHPNSALNVTDKTEACCWDAC